MIKWYGFTRGVSAEILSLVRLSSFSLLSSIFASFIDRCSPVSIPVSRTAIKLSFYSVFVKCLHSKLPDSLEKASEVLCLIIMCLSYSRYWSRVFRSTISNGKFVLPGSWTVETIWVWNSLFLKYNVDHTSICEKFRKKFSSCESVIPYWLWQHLAVVSTFLSQLDMLAVWSQLFGQLT